ncbi:MAG TPA: DUF4369 domain-containing protein, partial [Bacteroidetes bacterium]|nr:DUF4369 domain-containing protein [Bacteroidota bacterium]
MKTNFLLILALIGLACSSPKAKDNNKEDKAKTESTAQTNSDQKSTSNDVQTEDSMPVREGEVNMNFKINGLQGGGQTVDLVGMYMDKKYRADSIKLGQDGSFSIKNDVLYPDGFYYILLPGDKVLKLLLDEDQTFDFTADAEDIDHTAKINGSKTMELFYDDFNFKKDIDQQYVPIARKIGRMSPKDPEFDATYQEFLKLSNK